MTKEDFQVIEAMEAYGGSFVRAFSQAARRLCSQWKEQNDV